MLSNRFIGNNLICFSDKEKYTCKNCSNKYVALECLLFIKGHSCILAYYSFCCVDILVARINSNALKKLFIFVDVIDVEIYIIRLSYILMGNRCTFHLWLSYAWQRKTWYSYSNY